MRDSRALWSDEPALRMMSISAVHFADFVDGRAMATTHVWVDQPTHVVVSSKIASPSNFRTERTSYLSMDLSVVTGRKTTWTARRTADVAFLRTSVTATAAV
uniref:Uncharacterized protein n=1 Tax=Odontella aurita TaxID=265563 RepID=A0A7S4ITA9_9STRA